MRHKTLSLRVLFSFVCCLSLCHTMDAQQLTAHHNVMNDGYNFWVYTPSAYTDTTSPSAEAKPLVLFLHGGSLCGNDLNRVLRYGTIDALRRGRNVDAVVVAPQCPGKGWVPSKVMNVLEWVISHYTVDTNRIYVLGMSMGGIGTINFVGTYPHRVAAAMAICGAGRLPDYCGLTEVPFWVLHGTADRVIPLSESQKVVRSMASCGDTSRLIFTTLPGMNHSQPCQLFYLEDTYNWLFSHRLNDEARPLNRDYTLNRATLSKAYSNLTHLNIPVTHVYGPECSAKASAVAEAATPSNESGSGAQYHTIKKGDTLGGIAKRYHTTVKKLCQLNNMKETTVLKLGKKLRVR